MKGTDLLASSKGEVRNLSCEVNFGMGYMELSCLRFGTEILTFRVLVLPHLFETGLKFLTWR